jgi:hypothetical protein
VSLRLRLTAAFALVALLTAGAVALATPAVVGRGFALVEGPDAGTELAPWPARTPSRSSRTR